MRALLKMRVNPDDQTDGELEPEQSAMPIARYKKGDTVKITSGPFELHKALVETVANNRSWATVWVNVLGRDVLTKIADQRIAEVA
jgi:transcription antitermination factor NusG